MCQEETKQSKPYSFCPEPFQWWMCSILCVTLVWHTILLIKDGKIFDQWDSALLPWYSLEGSALFYTLHIYLSVIQGLGTQTILGLSIIHTSLGATRAWCRQFEDCYVKLKSKMCAGQPADSPSPYIVRNIYTDFTLGNTYHPNVIISFNEGTTRIQWKYWWGKNTGDLALLKNCQILKCQLCYWVQW